jgi:hypothetical protein
MQLDFSHRWKRVSPTPSFDRKGNIMTLRQTTLATCIVFGLLGWHQSSWADFFLTGDDFGRLNFNLNPDAFYTTGYVDLGPATLPHSSYVQDFDLGLVSMQTGRSMTLVGQTTFITQQVTVDHPGIIGMIPDFDFTVSGPDAPGNVAEFTTESSLNRLLWAPNPLANEPQPVFMGIAGVVSGNLGPGATLSFDEYAVNGFDTLEYSRTITQAGNFSFSFGESLQESESGGSAATGVDVTVDITGGSGSVFVDPGFGVEAGTNSWIDPSSFLDTPEPSTAVMWLSFAVGASAVGRLRQRARTRSKPIVRPSAT